MENRSKSPTRRGRPIKKSPTKRGRPIKKSPTKRGRPIKKSPTKRGRPIKKSPTKRGRKNRNTKGNLLKKDSLKKKCKRYRKQWIKLDNKKESKELNPVEGFNEFQLKTELTTTCSGKV